MSEIRLSRNANIVLKNSPTALIGQEPKPFAHVGKINTNAIRIHNMRSEESVKQSNKITTYSLTGNAN